MAQEDNTHTETSSSPLLRPVPMRVMELLEKRGVRGNDILMATDTDLAISGEYSESWVVVTKDEVLVYLIDEENDEVFMEKHLPITSIHKVRIDTRVGSGFLEAKTNDAYEEIARFSNKNADKFAKIAAQIRSLIVGKEVVLVSDKGEGREEPLKALEDAPHVKVHRGTVFIRFLAYVKRYRAHTVLAMVLVVATILLMLIPQQLVKILIDQVLEKKDPGTGWFMTLTKFFGLTGRVQWLYLLVGLLAATTLMASLIGMARESLAVWIGHRLGYDLRREVYAKLQDLEVRFHDTQPVGQLMTRCSQDVETLQSFINQITSGFGFQMLLVVGVAFTMFSMNWYLAAVACVPAPFVMACTVLFTRRVTPKWRKYWARRSDLNSGLHSVLSGIRVVKAFAQEQREEQRFGHLSGQFRDVGLDVGGAQARFYPTMSFVFQLGGYIIWIYGGKQILSGESATLTVGQLIAFLGYLGMFYAPLNSLTQMSTWFTQFTTQAHRVFEVLDQESEIKESADSVDVRIQGAIEFKEVSFGYDPHIPVLKDVSFSINPGEMVGIVGHSGSGKSTTVSLIMRFYNPTEGDIFLDNINIQRIRKHSVRHQVGLVAQDPFLFRGTVAENIAYGNPDVAPERILNAALQANAHMFITRNHDGYDSRLGERGSGLSGGERQRVAIARALLHEPRVLILDEATSSVDTVSEREIQHALEALSRGRTIIAIAHRLATLRRCDRLFVFEDGEIHEQGAHEELMAIRGGIYRRLVETQTELDTPNGGLGAPGDDAEDAALEQREREVAANARRRARNTETPRIHYLDPKEVRVSTLAEGDMQVLYKGAAYKHVRAYRCFPVSRPREFVALWVGDTALEHREVGMVRRLDELAPSARLAVELDLSKRYFIHYIEAIVAIKINKTNMGYLAWEVKTDKGDRAFLTRRWERRSVVEGGKNGRIIFDIHENRYEIVDLDLLDAASRTSFLNHIFW